MAAVIVLGQGGNVSVVLACEKAPGEDGKKIQRTKLADERRETEEFGGRRDQDVPSLRSRSLGACLQATVVCFIALPKSIDLFM